MEAEQPTSLAALMPAGGAGLHGESDPMDAMNMLRDMQLEAMVGTLTHLAQQIKSDPASTLRRMEKICHHFQGTLRQLGLHRFPEDEMTDANGYGHAQMGGLVQAGVPGRMRRAGNPDDQVLETVQVLQAALMPHMAPWMLARSIEAAAQAEALGMAEQAAQLREHAVRMSAEMNASQAQQAAVEAE